MDFDPGDDQFMLVQRQFTGQNHAIKNCVFDRIRGLTSFLAAFYRLGYNPSNTDFRGRVSFCLHCERTP